MTPAREDGEEGVGLTEHELFVLAAEWLARWAEYNEDWLLWEDLPGLGEHTFQRLAEVMVAFAESLRCDIEFNCAEHGIDLYEIIKAAQP